MKRFLILITIFVQSLLLCEAYSAAKNDSAKSESEKVKNINKDNQQQSNNKSGFNDIFLYASFGLSFLAFSGVVFIFIRKKKVIIDTFTDELKYELKKSDLRNIIKGVINNNEDRGKVNKTSFYSSGINQNQIKEISNDDLDKLFNLFIQKNMNNIIDQVLQSKRLDQKELESDSIKQYLSNSLQCKTDEVKVIYASSVDSRDKSFFKVSGTPNERTYFELILSKGKEDTAHFRVYENAKKAIISCPDHLNDACDYPILTDNHLISNVICQNGIAEKQSDGKWIVIKKAKINFE